MFSSHQPIQSVVYRSSLYFYISILPTAENLQIANHVLKNLCDALGFSYQCLPSGYSSQSIREYQGGREITVFVPPMRDESHILYLKESILIVLASLQQQQVKLSWIKHRHDAALSIDGAMLVSFSPDMNKIFDHIHIAEEDFARVGLQFDVPDLNQSNREYQLHYARLIGMNSSLISEESSSDFETTTQSTQDHFTVVTKPEFSVEPNEYAKDLCRIFVSHADYGYFVSHHALQRVKMRHHLLKKLLSTVFPSLSEKNLDDIFLNSLEQGLNENSLAAAFKIREDSAKKVLDQILKVAKRLSTEKGVETMMHGQKYLLPRYVAELVRYIVLGSMRMQSCAAILEHVIEMVGKIKAKKPGLFSSRTEQQENFFNWIAQIRTGLDMPQSVRVLIPFSISNLCKHIGRCFPALTSSHQTSMFEPINKLFRFCQTSSQDADYLSGKVLNQFLEMLISYFDAIKFNGNIDSLDEVGSVYINIHNQLYELFDQCQVHELQLINQPDYPALFYYFATHDLRIAIRQAEMGDVESIDYFSQLLDNESFTFNYRGVNISIAEFEPKIVGLVLNHPNPVILYQLAIHYRIKSEHQSHLKQDRSIYSKYAAELLIAAAHKGYEPAVHLLEQDQAFMTAVNKKSL